ncbi:MAG: leucine-rich repeat domain-containing protein, partial [Desulfobacterales bacterium]|nr:leucine-rich repeat domain-containing protein [Desulfobacterales bacterium]
MTIPSTVDHGPNTYTVTGIGDKAFQYGLLTSVTLPNTVTSIGEGAFNSNELASVVIPNSVTAIGYQAFSSNQLTEVTIPDSVTSIGGAAFQHNHLTRVTIGKSVTSIGTVAFRNNPGLATVVTKATIPPSLHANAFQNRGQIDVDVPLGKGQVYLNNGWTGFRSITEVAGVGDTFIADHITYKVTSLAPSPYEVKVADYAITGGAVTIPQTVDEGPNTYTVTAIGNEAFLGNQLTGVTLPNTVTSIGHWAFRNNPDLATVVTKATVPPSLHADAFQNADRNQIDVIVPMGKRQVYLDNGWTGFRSVTEVVPGVGDTFNADHITYKVTSLAPLKVEAIDYNTAGGPSVTIPPTVDDGPNTYTVTAIGNEAFEHNQLTGVIIPNTVTSIGKEAFRKNNLTEVTLPGGVTHIWDNAFHYNPTLETVTVEANDP